MGFRPGKVAFNAFGRILLRIMKRRIADRSVINLIWKCLKAGVMENGVRSFSKVGSPRGGTILALLANIYLNELDWELSNAGVQFVRYADDFLIFAKDEDGVRRGEAIVNEVMGRLKLDLSTEKTKTLHLMEKRTPSGRAIPELDYLGVGIQGWFRKRDGTWSFGLRGWPRKRSAYSITKFCTACIHSLFEITL